MNFTYNMSLPTLRADFEMQRRLMIKVGDFFLRHTLSLSFSLLHCQYLYFFSWAIAKIKHISIPTSVERLLSWHRFNGACFFTFVVSPAKLCCSTWSVAQRHTLYHRHKRSIPFQSKKYGLGANATNSCEALLRGSGCNQNCLFTTRTCWRRLRRFTFFIQRHKRHKIYMRAPCQSVTRYRRMFLWMARKTS